MTALSYIIIFNFSFPFSIDPWITNWFMAAGGEGQSYVMKNITTKLVSYWSDRNKIHEFYFHFHSIVADLYNSDPKFRQLVGEPEDAAGPHCISGNPLEQKMLKRCWQNLNLEDKMKLRYQLYPTQKTALL